MENSSNLPQEQFCDLTLDEAIANEMKQGRLNDPNIDLKKIRRYVSNKLSAIRCRAKMANRTRDMENQAKDLEAQISVLTPQVASWTEKKKQLQLEHDSLRQEVNQRSNESRQREMEIEETRAGIRRLKGREETAQKHKHAANPSIDSANEQSCQETQLVDDTENTSQQQEFEDVDQYINFDALDALGPFDSF